MTDVSVVANKDAWFLQGIGSTGKYGNGTGDYIHVGRVPSGTSDPDWKSRGVFEVQLRNGSTGVLDNFGSVSAADFELTVGPETCLVGGRGSNFYAFLEEITGDFTSFNAGGNCSFGSSGPSTGEWGADTGATTTNRVFKSAPGLATGNKVTFNNTAMVQAWLADPSKTEARLRVIFANSAGTAYDETAGATRGTGFYASEHATSGNRPVLHVTGSSAAVAKSDTENLNVIEDGETVQTFGTTPSDTDNLSFVETQAAGPIGSWEIVSAGTDQGKGKVILPNSSTNTYTKAVLTTVSEQDVNMLVKFQVNKIPSSQWVLFAHIARWQSETTFYWASAVLTTDNTIELHLTKWFSGSFESLGSVPNFRSLVVGTDYWLRFLVQGVAPTTLAARIWRDGEIEPSGWQITNQDNEAVLQTAGAVGLMAAASSVGNLPIAISFDNFEAIEP